MKPFVVAMLLCAAPVSAQVMDSGQCHWLQPNGMLGHTHIDLDTINRPQVNGTLRVNFVVTLFHTDAPVTQIYAGNAKTNDAFDWVWDDTGTSAPPLMIGDPMGVRTWSGHFRMTPAYPHGWQWVSMSVYTRFADRTTVVILNEPIYATANLNAPEGDASPAAQRAQAICRVSPDPAHPELSYGEQTAQFDGPLPRFTMSQLVPMTGSTYGYGARGLPFAVADFRLDMDLHHGVNGTLLYTAQESVDGLIHAPMNFDPALMGPGEHKLAIRRTEINGPETSAVLLVTHVTIDPNAPPPVDPPSPPSPPPSSPPSPPPPPQGVKCTLRCK